MNTVHSLIILPDIKYGPSQPSFINYYSLLRHWGSTNTIQSYTLRDSR